MSSTFLEISVCFYSCLFSDDEEVGMDILDEVVNLQVRRTEAAI